MPIHPNVKRCQHTKIDGGHCGAPALKGKPRCRFHAHVLRPSKHFVLPPLEDTNSIQVAIMEVMRALLEDRIARPKANTLLYALQIAHSNLRGLTLLPEGDDAEGERQDSLAERLLRELGDVSEPQARTTPASGNKAAGNKADGDKEKHNAVVEHVQSGTSFHPPDVS